MVRKLWVLSCVSLVACGAAEQPGEVPDDAVANGADAGRAAYEAACASCHDAGSDGAPRTGYPEDWTGRSTLWQSVLVEHAKAGYLEMPAKGGDPVIDDESVSLATEYMLQKSHPDRLPDQ